MIGGLTAYERETIITMNDEDALAQIWTAQRRLITRLQKNQAARLLEQGTHGRTAWARFEIPKELISLRSAQRRPTRTSGQGFAKNQPRSSTTNVNPTPQVDPRGGDQAATTIPAPVRAQQGLT